MACGNNKVSRSALHTPPRPTGRAHPITVVPWYDRPPAPDRIQRTETTIGKAQAEVERSKSPADVRQAVGTAQLAVVQARRSGLGRDALRRLERGLAHLERAASQALAQTEAEENQRVALRMRQTVDRLAPTMLGLRTRVAMPQDAVPQAQSGDDRAVVDATRRAQQAIERVADLHLTAFTEEKKAAQRALNAAKRRGAPVEQFAALEAALKTLQRAEAARRSEAGSAELPFGTLDGSGLRAERTETLHARTQVSYAALQPSAVYTFGAQTYVTDANGQPAFAAGELHLQESHASLRHKEGTAIGKLGNDNDVGGHLIAAMFGGFGSGPNLIPQNVTLNSNTKQAYGQLETTWRQLLELGARVHVDIRLQESSTNPNRPEGILARWRIDASNVDVSEVLDGGAFGTHENFFPNDAPS